MSDLVQGVRSVLFIGQMYLVMALMGIACTPVAMVWRDAALAAMRAYCHWVRWTARWMVGLHSEVRGKVPEGEVMIAAKHQSFFDILILFSVLPQPRFVMKKELTRAPFLGWYARRIGCVAVDRGKRSQAVRQMLADVQDGGVGPAQLVIYPQGTRVPPGEWRDYKPGTAILYEALGQPCVPVAANVGLFWPKRSLMRRRGTAVVAFLDPIAPGAPMKGFLAELAETIEGESDRLMAEAGYRPEQGPGDADASRRD